MKYLLDTNILSEGRKKQPEAKLVKWMKQADADSLFVSVLTIGELTKGIELRRRHDPAAANALMHWLDGLEQLFSSHIIGIDEKIAIAWGRMNAKRPYPVIDSLLAATALVYDMTLVTRNVKDIHDAGVSYFNPWDA